MGINTLVLSEGPRQFQKMILVMKIIFCFYILLIISIEYDLSDGNWFILLSTGGVTSSQTQYHGSSAAGRAIASSQRVMFSSNQPHIFLGQESSSTSSLKAHAILMVFAWALLAPLG